MTGGACARSSLGGCSRWIRPLGRTLPAFLVLLEVPAEEASWQALAAAAAPVPVTPRYRGKRSCTQARQQRLAAEQHQRHALWVARYEAIHALYAQATSVGTSAQHLGVSRPTV